MHQCTYMHMYVHAHAHILSLSHTHTLQGAAGTYQRLREMVFAYLQTPPTPDMAADSTNALQSLMLAQAQECFVMKASRGW